jgi:hypothetical protein
VPNQKISFLFRAEIIRSGRVFAVSDKKNRGGGDGTIESRAINMKEQKTRSLDREISDYLPSDRRQLPPAEYICGALEEDAFVVRDKSTSSRNCTLGSLNNTTELPRTMYSLFALGEVMCLSFAGFGSIGRERSAGKFNNSE